MFKFKQFSVAHTRSSMKVGVDAVLLGAWAGKDGGKILDVGTGCGVISLILAQRFPNSDIEAIDIDQESVEEASQNFLLSSWGNRLEATVKNFPKDFLKIIESNENGMTEFKGYDLIVSNPPYFQSGINSPSTRREIARHQASLSVFSLVETCGKLLKPEGRLAIIYPLEYHEETKWKATNNNLYLLRECLIKDSKKKKGKRVMAEFGCFEPDKIVSEELILFKEGIREPSEQYRELCKELYLKF